MRRFIPLVAIAPMLIACDESLLNPPNEDASPVVTFDEFEVEVGRSELTRRSNGISFNLETTELEPETATTAWIVIFNKPEYCATSPCGDPDLFEPDVMADMVGGFGQVIGDSGEATFSGSRSTNDTTGSALAALGLPAYGIIDPDKAEIHFVLRSHGPAIPGMIEEMTTTFNGGCQHPGEPFPDPLPPELGEPGPNTCVDVQFAVHQP